MIAMINSFHLLFSNYSTVCNVFIASSLSNDVIRLPCLKLFSRNTKGFLLSLLCDGNGRFHDSIYPKPLNIHLVTSTESAEFTHLVGTLSLTSIIGLDVKWKPFCLRSDAERYTVPTVSLLQVVCQLDPRHSSRSEDSVVFLLDLCSIHLPAIWPMLRDVFVSRDVLKLGFQFKQDLVNLSHTFVSQGCEPGFDRVEPYMDISSMYTYLQSSQLDSIPKATKGLAAICNEVLGISLSKELQCSDWSSCPLTEDQKIYTAADVDCLLEIFSSFRAKVAQEENSHDRPWRNILPMEESLLEIVRDFGEDMTVGKSIKTTKGCGRMVGKPVKTPKTSKKAFKNSFKKAETSTKEQKIINDEEDPSPPPIQESLAKLVRGFGKLMVDSPENLKGEEKIESSLTITDGQGPQPIEESPSRLGRNSRKDISEHNYVKRPSTPKEKGKVESSEAIGYRRGCVEETPAKSPRNLSVDKSIKTPNISTGKEKIACSIVHDLLDLQLLGKSPLKAVKRCSKKVKVDESVKTAKQIKRKDIIESVVSDWQGPPPWDSALGGDRCPKFLCDKMFKGLAKHLRYLGIDAALPSKKRVIKELFNQSYKEKRVLLTDDVSLLGSTIVYLLKTTGKDEQLLEVFNTFQLKITKGQLASRCCDCNGTWIKFITGEEVVEAADSIQMKTAGKNWGFWKCMDCTCNQLRWDWEVQVPPRCFHCSGKSTRPLRAEEAVEVAKDMERTLGKNVVFGQCLGCSQLHWEGNYCMLLLKLIDAGKFYDLT